MKLIPGNNYLLSGKVITTKGTQYVVTDLLCSYEYCEIERKNNKNYSEVSLKFMTLDDYWTTDGERIFNFSFLFIIPSQDCQIRSIDN